MELNDEEINNNSNIPLSVEGGTFGFVVVRVCGYIFDQGEI